MSIVNFFKLDDPGYGNIAKGILYAIYELFWKIVYAVGNLIDVITGLFYKLVGVNYLGSGSENLVEEQDLLSQLFNQNIVSNVSLFMLFTSVILMAIFGTIAVIKQMYFSKEETKSTVGVIRNMVLAFFLLICLAPLSLFAISSISTITTAIVGIFGDNSNISLADLIFNISFSGDPVEAYNAMYGTEITSWKQMENGFLFDLEYGGTGTVTFYWYVYLLGGGVIVFNLVVIVLKLIKRIFNIIVLYLVAPFYIARMVDDGGSKLREWKNKALPELFSIIGTVIVFMILISLVGVINDLELVKVTTEATGDGSLGAIKALADGETEVNETVLLINNLTKMLLLMAGTTVAKDSGELLGNTFRSSNDDSGAILEGIFNRLGPKEQTPIVKGESSTPRTRVITKTSTSTRKIINYNESVSSDSEKAKPTVNVNSSVRNNVNMNVSNVDRHVNNIQNRANVSLAERETRSNDSGAIRGNYKTTENAVSSFDPTEVLDRSLSGYKRENDKIRQEWGFMKNSNSASSREVVKEFESASKDLDNSISSGEQTKIKSSMVKYVEAYKKEEKVAKEGYRDFASKSTKLSNDLSSKQQEELKKITTAYRKAQVEYGKTARKLSEISSGNMSTADALRVKERADKQREKLMEASSKANDFYNNQKKGV